MKKIIPLATALMLIATSVAIPANQMAKETIALAEDSEQLADSITDSNVYWDIYKMFSAKYIENWNSGHPDNQITTFNPYFLTPNYGDYHGSSYKSKLLAMYPYGNDMYIYTWQDTSDIASDVWDGQSIHVRATTNTNGTSSGYNDSEEFIDYTANLVNTHNLSAQSNNNWLAKWVIKNVIDNADGAEAYRFKVDTMYLDNILSETVINLGATPTIITLNYYRKNGYIVYRESPLWYARKIIGHIREIQCGDELIYTKTDTLNDFNYHYSQPDYINITSKTGALYLSGKDLPGFQGYFEADPNNTNGRNAMGYSAFDENFYCFFNVGSYSLDSKVYDEALRSVESITYSYNLTTYQHISSQFNAFAPEPEPLCFGGLYDNKYLYKDASFVNVGKPVNSGEKIVNANENETYDHELFTLFWIETRYAYSTASIIDCSGETNVPDTAEFRQLKDFIKTGRQFDSNGDGTNDKQYRWAFRLGQTERRAETIEYGTTLFNSWGKWKSTCHQFDDIVILRMKFVNSDYLNFDLLAMDVNTPTESVQIRTGGREYVVLPKILQDLAGWFEDNSTLLIAIGVSVLVLAALVGIGYVFMPLITASAARGGRRRE